jgi:hypothetical protein
MSLEYSGRVNTGWSFDSCLQLRRWCKVEIAQFAHGTEFLGPQCSLMPEEISL